MPCIPIEVQEFVPKGYGLLYHTQYRPVDSGSATESVKTLSPSLGLNPDDRDQTKYDDYINTIITQHLEEFVYIYMLEENNDVLRYLFVLMTRVKLKNDDEINLLSAFFRLLVVTFIMSHVLNIAEEGKHNALESMHSYAGRDAYKDRLQHILESAECGDNWLTAFVEDQQKAVHNIMSTKASTEGVDVNKAQSQAEAACREIDASIYFMMHLFKSKYGNRYDQLGKMGCDGEKEVQFSDKDHVQTVKQMAQLFEENSKSYELVLLVMNGRERKWINADDYISELFERASNNHHFA